jgi:FAD/FMN-containing dehydrogenase
MPELPRDPDTLAAYADDWGHMVSRTPRAVVLPATIEEVAATVRNARADGTTVVARGRGHAMGGDAQVEDGIVIDMSGLDQIEAPAGDSVWVHAGATWEALLESMFGAGVAPLVVPHYPRLSVGGVLSGAGVGLTSVRHGLTTDTVLELDVVTGSGELLRCSSEVRPDLFHAVVGGLGQFAIIVRARVRVEPVPERLFEAVFAYDDLKVFFEALIRAASHPDVTGLLGMTGIDEHGKPVCGLHADMPGGREADAAVASLADVLPPSTGEPYSYELPLLEHFELMSVVEERYRTTTDYWERIHPWFGVLLPAAGAARFLEEHLEEMVQAEGRDRIGNAVIYVVSGRPADVVGPPLPDSDPVFGFTDNGGFPNTPENIAWAGERNRRLYDAAKRLGGTLGPFGYMPMSSEDWRTHFGPRWDELLGAKRRYDPDGVLARDLSR